MEYGDQNAFDVSNDRLHILPVSAIEQHGPHLPASTDALIVEALKGALDADEVLREEFVWLPHLCYGTSEEHRGLPPTLSLKPATLVKVVEDLVESLALQGVECLAILNGHGGNVPVLQACARDVLVRWGVRTFFLRPLSILPGRSGGKVEMHAGAMETSLILHLHPNLVDTSLVPSVEEMQKARSTLLKSLERGGGPQFAWRTADLTSNGVIGEPSEASAGQGRLLFDRMVEYLREELTAIRAITHDSRPADSID